MSYRKRLCAVFAFFMILLVSLPGCMKNYTENLLPQYKAFLTYSLGEHTLADKGREHWTDGIGYFGYYRWWDMAYTSSDGKDRVFRFNNYGHSHPFASSVMQHAQEIAAAYIKEDLQEKAFSKSDWDLPLQFHYVKDKTNIQSEDDLYVNIDMKHPSDDAYMQRLTDTQNGLKLRSVTPQELVRDWDCTFAFDFHLLSSDSSAVTTLKKKLEPLWRHVAAYLQQETIPVTFHFEYNKESDVYAFGLEGLYSASADSLAWDKEDIIRSSIYLATASIHKDIRGKITGGDSLTAMEKFKIGCDETEIPDEKRQELRELLTPRELAKLDCRFTFHARIRFNEEQSREEQTDEFLPIVRYMADSLGQAAVRVTFQDAEQGSSILWGTYERASDAFDFSA